MTWSRRNRRRDEFGIKGVSHHATSKLGVIIDTSGSICSDELKQFFAEIEAISYRAKTWILQWDAGFQDYAAKYRRGDWKNIQIKGRGGTDMAAAVQWVVDNKVQADAVVLLTDGYTPWPEKTPFPMIFCVTDENQVENAPEWGTRCHVKAK
jgi:predicted metal-dependent peptidase